MEPAQNHAHIQEHERQIRPFSKTMETLQNIWKAIDDSGVLWMFEAVWPVLQAIGILLAVVVFGIAWLWLANAAGEDDEEVEDFGVPVFGLTPDCAEVDMGSGPVVWRHGDGYTDGCNSYVSVHDTVTVLDENGSWPRN